MMTIDQDVVLMIEKIVTTNQEEMAISNLEDVLTIKKMAITNQGAALMISQEEEMQTLSLDVVLMKTSLEDVLMLIINRNVFRMINQIVDTGNKTLRDFS